jgi:hypothetical protein
MSSLTSVTSAVLPEPSSNAGTTDRRTGADRRRSLAKLPVKATGHRVFFDALAACGINGETARFVCGEPGKPIGSGEWSRMKKADPTDPKTPRLLVEHIDRALAEFGPEFRAEYQRRWDAAFRPEARPSDENAALLDVVASILDIVNKLVPARHDGAKVA